MGPRKATDLSTAIKGSLIEDFRLQDFHESVSPVPVSIPLRPFKICMKICRDISNFVFIPGINDTGNKMFIGVNGISDKLPPCRCLPAINIAGVFDTCLVLDSHQFHDTGDKFMAGKHDACNIFIACVSYTGDKTVGRMSPNISLPVP